MDGGFTTADLHDIGLPFIGDDDIEHALYLFQGTVPAVGRGGGCVAGRAAQVAAVGNLDQGEAGMLLVIGTEAAIIRTAIVDFGIESSWIFGSFVVVADVFVIFHISSYQYALAAVLRAAFEHVDFIVFKNDFGFDTAQTFWAETEGEVVIDVFAFWHRVVVWAKIGIFFDLGLIKMRFEANFSSGLWSEKRKAW
ncbi:MAG: hypothetical protein DHS20C18_36410 [Saprospiraceae bacterium]|nr:MAG: hypothetical protein DHS20C18_36410 [Saprospiraceae bacterium]